MYYFYLVRSVEAYDVNIYRMHAAFMKDAVFTHFFSVLVSIVANYHLMYLCHALLSFITITSWLMAASFFFFLFKMLHRKFAKAMYV